MVESRVLIVIPSYRVSSQIEATVKASLLVGDHVLVVDDACPERSGGVILEKFPNIPSVSVIFHDQNRGVGGAMKTGFDWALERGYEIVVKVDGDGQMDPVLVPDLINSLLNNEADFAKGNRFDSPRSVRQMPKLRLIGNGFLSLLSKFSSGYWSLNDPTNGFIAIRKAALQKLDIHLLSDGFFFESDLLFRLSIIRARITQLSMTAVYGDEKSSLRISKVLLTFPFLHFRNFSKRVLYSYYVRDWSIGSIELPIGVLALVSGVIFGSQTFEAARVSGETVTAGQAVLTAIGVILGTQFIISFLSHDIQNEPKH